MVMYCIVKIDFQVHALEAHWRYAGVTVEFIYEIHHLYIGIALGVISPEGGVVLARGGSVAVPVMHQH